MNKLLRPLLLATALVPSVALADYPFILPSSTNLSGNDNIVTFDAAGSDHLFFFDHRAVPLASIVVTKPDGTPAAPINTLQSRFRSVFDVKLDQQGTWKVASDQAMVMGSFKVNGEERRVGGRGGPPPGQAGGPGGPGNGEGPRAVRPGAPGGPEGAGPPGAGRPMRQPPVAVQDIPADATDVHLVEIVRTTTTFVTEGAPTTAVFKPTGRGLEFEPISHPNSLAMGEDARFRFLIDGKPVAGVKVTVVPGGERYREEREEKEYVTGADGVVTVIWPAAGMYWLGAEAEDKNPTEKRAETRRMSTAVTLEVATP